MRPHHSFATDGVERIVQQVAPQDSAAGPLAGALLQGFDDISHQDGFLTRYAGPALLVDVDHRVLATNLPGAALAEALHSGRAPNLAHFVSTCIVDNVARYEEALLPCGSGGKMMETSILPSGDGVTAVVLCRDVTLARGLRATLSESHERYKDLAEIAGGFAWETGPDGRFAFVSPRGVLGHTASAMIGRSPKELMVQESGRRELHDLPFTTRENVENAQFWAYRQDGTKACLSVSAVPLFGVDGNWRGARGICRDITETVSRDAALARAQTRERLLRHILRIVRDETEPSEMLARAAADTARALDADACLVFRGDNTTSLTSVASFGAAVGAVDVSTLLAQVVETQNPVVRAGWLVAPIYYRRAISGVVALWRAGGEQAWTSDDQTLLANVADYFSIVVAQIVSHEQLCDMMRTDEMTGLLNRQTFKAELARRWQRARYSARGVLIHCGLDNANGDDCRRRVAEILAGMTRGHDLVARLGEDEFAVWLEDADTSVIYRKAEGIVTAIGVPSGRTGAPPPPLAVSLGIAVPDGKSGRDERLEDFLARADAAMHRVQQTGKGGIVLADPPQIHQAQQ